MSVHSELQQIAAFIAEEYKKLDDEVTGQVENTVQAIVDIWEIDCVGSYVLWIKTATWAVYKTLYMFVMPQPEEIFENYLEPKPGRRGGRRGQPEERFPDTDKNGNRRVGFGGGIPDIDQAIASRLPATEIVAGRLLVPNEWVIWTGINVTDRLLFFWMLLEATETFTTTWQSGLLASQKCGFLNAASCSANVNIQNALTPDYLWVSALALANKQEDNMSMDNHGFIAFSSDSGRGDALILISVNFTLVNANLTEDVVREVGILVNKTNPGEMPKLLNNTTVVLSAGPGQQVSQNLEVAIQESWFNTCQCFQTLIGGSGGGNISLTYTAQIAAALRNVGNVV